MTKNQRKGTTQRLLHAQLLSFEVKAYMKKLKKQVQWRNGDRNAMTLVKSSALRIVLVGLRKGATMREHQVEGPITLFVLEGSIRFVVGAKKCKLLSNSLMTLDKTIPHDVEAVRDSVFLLTIVQP